MKLALAAFFYCGIESTMGLWGDSYVHETPARFGADDAQAIMGFQMAVAYIGSTLLPPLFGFIAAPTTLALLPGFLAAYGLALLLGAERLRRVLRSPPP